MTSSFSVKWTEAKRWATAWTVDQSTVGPHTDRTTTKHTLHHHRVDGVLTLRPCFIIFIGSSASHDLNKGNRQRRTSDLRSCMFNVFVMVSHTNWISSENWLFTNFLGGISSERTAVALRRVTTEPSVGGCWRRQNTTQGLLSDSRLFHILGPENQRLRCFYLPSVKEPALFKKFPAGHKKKPGRSFVQVLEQTKSRRTTRPPTHPLFKTLLLAYPRRRWSLKRRTLYFILKWSNEVGLLWSVF